MSEQQLKDFARDRGAAVSPSRTWRTSRAADGTCAGCGGSSPPESSRRRGRPGWCWPRRPGRPERAPRRRPEPAAGVGGGGGAEHPVAAGLRPARREGVRRAPLAAGQHGRRRGAVPGPRTALGVARGRRHPSPGPRQIFPLPRRALRRRGGHDADRVPATGCEPRPELDPAGEDPLGGRPADRAGARCRGGAAAAPTRVLGHAGRARADRRCRGCARRTRTSSSGARPRRSAPAR